MTDITVQIEGFDKPLVFPEGTGDDVIQRIVNEQIDSSRAIPESRTGIVPENIRRDVRGAIEAAPAPVGFAAEMSPAITGTAFGGLVGSMFGPVGLLLGGAFGGFVGEFLGQETGVTPQSDVGLGLAAAGPTVGRVLGPAFQAVKRAGVKAALVPSPAKAALARTIVSDAVDTLGSFGARVLAKQTGLMAQPANQLYKAAREVGARLNPRNSKTLKSLDALEAELADFATFPEIKQAMRLLGSVRASLDKDFISFSEVIGVKKLVGVAVAKAEKALIDSGTKLGSAKLVFKALADDIDDLAKFGKGLKGKGARLVQIATKRAKLEFSIDELQTVVSRHTQLIPDQAEAVLDINALRNTLRDMLDPASKAFKKNFADALGDQIKPLMDDLAGLAKLSKSLNPAGPGSLVIRGLGGAAGGAVGFAAAGPVGAIIGTIGGVGLPEMIMGVLLSTGGRKALRTAMIAGKGQLDAQQWQLIGQAVVQSLKPVAADLDGFKIMDNFVGGG